MESVKLKFFLFLTVLEPLKQTKEERIIENENRSLNIAMTCEYGSFLFSASLLARCLIAMVICGPIPQ